MFFFFSNVISELFSNFEPVLKLLSEQSHRGLSFHFGHNHHRSLKLLGFGKVWSCENNFFFFKDFYHLFQRLLECWAVHWLITNTSIYFSFIYSVFILFIYYFLNNSTPLMLGMWRRAFWCCVRGEPFHCCTAKSLFFFLCSLAFHPHTQIFKNKHLDKTCSMVKIVTKLCWGDPFHCCTAKRHACRIKRGFLWMFFSFKMSNVDQMFIYSKCWAKVVASLSDLLAT